MQVRRTVRVSFAASLSSMLLFFLYAAPPARSQTCVLWWDISAQADSTPVANGAQAVVISPDNQYVYVASKSGNAVSGFFRVSAAGSVQTVGITDLQPLASPNPWVHGFCGPGADGLSGADGVVISPDGTDLYVAGNNDNSIGHFKRNTATGQLACADDVGIVNGFPFLTNASNVTVTPDGDNVYATAQMSGGAITSFFRCAGQTPPPAYCASLFNGALSTQQSLKNGQQDGFGNPLPSTGLSGATAAAVSPDGNNVYVTAFTDDALTVFKRRTDAGGALQYLETHYQSSNAGLNGAFAVVVSPDGANVYVAGQAANQVAIFSRNTSTGLLTYSGAITVGNGPSGLAMVDNSRLWVTLKSSNALVVYLRNGNGLTLLESVTNGQSQPASETAGWPNPFAVSGLSAPIGVAVSGESTGGNVYVAASSSNAITWFSEFDPTTVTCNDGNQCTGPDTCQSNGNCAVGGSPCQGNGTCAAPNLASGTACTSGACTSSAACDGNGTCVDQTCTGAGCGCGGVCKFGTNGKCGCL